MYNFQPFVKNRPHLWTRQVPQATLRTIELLLRVEVSASNGIESMAELQNSFQLKWRGDTLIVSPTGHVEELSWDLIEQAATIVMQPIKTVKLPNVLFDLSKLKFVGSVFLSLMLRCYKLVKSRGGEFVLCGANGMARELLRVTSLDTLWPIYDSREEALMSLEGD